IRPDVAEPPDARTAGQTFKHQAATIKQPFLLALADLGVGQRGDGSGHGVLACGGRNQRRVPTARTTLGFGPCASTIPAREAPAGRGSGGGLGTRWDQPHRPVPALPQKLYPNVYPKRPGLAGTDWHPLALPETK